ncbi:MAG: gamma-glutamyltransferase [Rhizobiales bacterium]|nr:gamma-glutamyltransferase [Hyphomicrobiales bacterium]
MNDAIRPLTFGRDGAVSAAHPSAVEAGLAVLARGGNACDAMIAAQAALAVVAPSSCGLGGDLLALVRTPTGDVTAINGTGRAASAPRFTDVADDGRAVTVPGLVAGWQEASRRFGRLDLGGALEPAIALARHGCELARDVTRAVRDQEARLARGGAADWSVARQARSGMKLPQPELADLLAAIAHEGADAFYRGAMAEAIAAAVARTGGMLTADDLARHETAVLDPITVPWRGGHVHVQPPMTQGVLLAMCLAALERMDVAGAASLDHLCVELTEASFQFRDRAAEGVALLDERLDVDPQRAMLRGGPRAYLHTAGVASADADGMVCSSLISVFDDFGSAILVPEGGFTLNNRAQGFTVAPNAPRPGARPVHTLAPAMWVEAGRVTALATPGADGQIQTLLQILARSAHSGLALADSIAAPRWRSEGGSLLVERDHPEVGGLTAAGHRVALRESGDMCFGGVVAAGYENKNPFATSDWRRQVMHGAC